MTTAAAERISTPVMSFQTDAKLSHEHSLTLLHKLATDDGFRSRYEQNPAAALAEVGVPPETVASFMASCVTSGQLVSKERFAAAHRQLRDAGAEACVQFAIPDPRLDFGRK
jgi:putative modified peptide